MTKGYIEIEVFPSGCLVCQFWSRAECLAFNPPKYIPYSSNDEKPDFCPIKEHDLWKCVQKHKEEMLAFHKGQRSKDAP